MIPNAVAQARTIVVRQKPILANVLLIVLLAAASLPLADWAVLQAIWTGTAQDCLNAPQGACWAFVSEKIRFILFGFYPPVKQWRPALVLAALAGLLALSAIPRFWSRCLLAVWLLAIPLVPLFMSGIGPLHPVATNDWGGLPVTLMVSLAGIAFAFPIAVMMALARQSSMRILKWLAIGYIELLRAVPMIVVLYVAMLIAPMAMPPGMLADKLLRAQIGVTVFTSAYLAEIIRAGLQTIPKGQYDAGAALGLTAWQQQYLIILPQALRVVIPAIVNLSVGILLNTSLLAVIGIYDLLNTAKASAADPSWLGYYTEAYLLVAAIYLGISYGLSRYSLWLEKRLGL